MFDEDDKDYMEEEPISDGIYCFTGKAGNRYHTLLVSSLLPYFLYEYPAVYETEVGQHRFITVFDGPVYLVGYNKQGINQVTERYETYDLFPNGIVPPGKLASMTVPMEFNLGVEEIMDYKLEFDKLYKREGTEWILMDL